MKRKVISTLFAFAVTATAVHAQMVEELNLNPIFTAIPSLSIAPDARAGGMGDVGTATMPDVFSQHWNPSKYAFMESPAGFAFSYTPWLSQLVDDINLFYAVGYWKPDEFQAFSASIRYFSLGNVTLRRFAEDIPITARPNEFAFDLAYSRKLSESFSASVAFRYIRGDLNIPQQDAEMTPMYPANAIAADISAFYTTPITMATGDANLAFGANISNIGNRISYDDGITFNFLPTNLRLGTSFDMPIDNFNRISFSADANKLLVVSRGGRFAETINDVTLLQSIFGSFTDTSFQEQMRTIMWSVGTEYVYNDQFFVRAGYFHEHFQQGGRKYFTVGAGFKLNVFQLDAGFVIATTPINPLNNTLRVSLSFDLDGLRDLMN